LYLGNHVLIYHKKTLIKSLKAQKRKEKKRKNRVHTKIPCDNHVSKILFSKLIKIKMIEK
jgi:hypothetical protein